MKVTLTAMGGGTPDAMTMACKTALEEAGCILGAQRLLNCLPESCTQNRIAAVRPEDILEKILEQQTDCAVAFSGDTGFYSGAKNLLPLLQEQGIKTRILPGVSSVQLLAARLGRPWQDWNLVSAHGRACNILAAVSKGKPALFLTGGAFTVAEICQQLTDAGLGKLPVTAGEQLSYPEERIVMGTAAQLASLTFSPLTVLLAEAAPQSPQRCSGIPDEQFSRGDVPMTKQEVRAVALAKLAVGPADVLWDVGAGTGSVSVELALAAPEGQVFAVEYREKACKLIRANRKQFSVWNLKLVERRAPEALTELPPPDGVFIGGTKGEMDRVVHSVLEKNPNARICISAIALESLSAAVTALTEHSLEARVTQIAVSRSNAGSGLHMLLANNPVFLITGNCDA